MFRTIQMKLKIIGIVLKSKSCQVVFQRSLGQECNSAGFGRGDLKDLVLFSKELKSMCDSFLGMINEAAAEAGELHSLQALHDAVEVLEKEAKDGRN